MKYQKTLLRRYSIAAELADNRDKPFSIKVFAMQHRVDQRIARYDLGWLEMNQGLILEFPRRDIVVCRGTREIPGELISRPGHQHADIGLCNFCSNQFIQTGHNRFCGDACQVTFNSMTFEERRIHKARQFAAMTGETPVMPPEMKERLNEALAEPVFSEPGFRPKQDPSLEGDHDVPAEGDLDLID